MASQTAFVRKADLAANAVWLVWVFGVILPIIVSTLGNYIAFIGGYSKLSWEVNWYIVGGAIVWQIPTTYAQWVFKSKAAETSGLGWWVAYFVALLISVIPAFIGYHPPIAAYLLASLPKTIDTTTATALIALFVFIGCAIGDMLPEWVGTE